MTQNTARRDPDMAGIEFHMLPYTQSAFPDADLRGFKPPAGSRVVTCQVDGADFLYVVVSPRPSRQADTAENIRAELEELTRGFAFSRASLGQYMALTMLSILNGHSEGIHYVNLHRMLCAPDGARRRQLAALNEEAAGRFAHARPREDGSQRWQIS